LLKSAIKTRYPDVIRILRLIRYELAALKSDWLARLSLRQAARLRRLRKQRGIRLNIANGRSKKEGWVNLDVTPAADVCMDLRRKLPFADRSVALIFTEHFCDHINFPDMISRFLAECHRVLEPGGRARFVIHDAEGLMRACVERDKRYFEVGEQMHQTMMVAVNHLFRMNDFHQFLYDYETFAMLLSKAGFNKIKRCGYLQSECPDLVLDYVHPHREVLSMYIEAQKDGGD
jgi:predicted SAM-dependent methyltransferase